MRKHLRNSAESLLGSGFKGLSHKPLGEKVVLTTLRYYAQELHQGGEMTDRVKLTSMAKAAG